MSAEVLPATARAAWPAFVPRGGSLPEDVWNRRHAGILGLLWVHAAVVPAFAIARGYDLTHIALESVVVPLTAAAATWSGTTRRVRTVLASLGLLLSSAVLVHLSGGVIEMHFHFFVMVAAVALYQDWIPFLAAIAFVFVHHGVVGVLDANGVYNHAAAWRSPWTWAAIHAFFISGISGVCLVTWGMNERTLAQRTRAEERLRNETRVVEVLNDVGRALAAELDTQRVIQKVTDAGTEMTNAAFGAFFYNVVDADGESYMLYTLSGAPVEAFGGIGLPRNTAVFAPTFSGEGVVRLDDVTADARYGHNAPHFGMPDGHLGVRSYLASPVKSRTGEVLGGLFFGHPEPGRFTVDDERIVVGIAAQAAVAIDNARLYESEHQARAAAEDARDALTMLTDASRALTSSLELDAILRGLASVVTSSVADHCAIDLADEDGRLRRVTPAENGEARTAVSETAAPRPGDDQHPVVAAIRTRATQLVPAAGSADGPSARATTIVTPLLGRHRVLGALTMSATGASGRALTADHIPVVEDLGRRAAIAIENAQLYARQRTVAETLQHSLLPERLPDIPGVEAAARYLAGADVEVGGDWYDLIRLPRGDLAITMGDVVGRGEKAASLMGQLRNAVRAYALDGKGPADIASAVNALLLDAGSEQMATMVYAVIDAEDGELRFVNAGHPPPLVVDPEGTATYVEDGGGVPLGATQAARYHERRCPFPAGSTILLYTDGLVEDRSEALQTGLDRLRAAVLEGPTDLDELCAHLVDSSLQGRDVHDDTALLALRVLPLGPRLRLQLPSDPAILTPLRATLRRWLVEAGADDTECYELLVAAGEASSNAIRHASGPASSSFEVEASADEPGKIEIVVRDRGRWRERPSGDGGRGLGIIETFVDSVSIVRSPEGTEVTMRRRLEQPAVVG